MMPQSPSSTPARDRLSLRENIGYGLGDTASNLFFQTFGIFLLYYYTDVFGIPAAALTTMFFVTRLWDAVNDPIMGMIADRTETRWGKFRPYLLWAAVPYGICGYLLFANPGFDPSGRLVYAWITYTLMMMAYTAINVPYSSLMGVISPSSRARTVASSFRFVGAFGGGLVVSMAVRPLVRILGGESEIAGFQLTMAIFAVLSILLFWTTFATTRERVRPPVGQRSDVRGELGELLKNRPWMILLVAAICSTSFIATHSAGTIHYFKYYAGDDGTPVLWFLDKASLFLSLGMLCKLLGVIAVGFLSAHFDKKPLTVGLTLGSAVCLALFFLLPPEAYGWMLAVNVLGSLMLGPTSALVWAMYADVADYGEWKFGRRSTGLIYSASLFALKTGTMVAGVLPALLLARFGFVPNVAQTAGAILGIKLVFSLVPAVFATLKAVAIWVYPLDQVTVDEIERALRERKEGGEVASPASAR